MTSMIQKNNTDPIVITACNRTGIGQLMGQFNTVRAPELGAAVIKDLLKRAPVPMEDISEIIMGCVLPAGQGQAPARQAAIFAGLPYTVGATTINKMCGSGMKAMMLAHDLLLSGSNRITIAGGMESMTNAPYLLSKARQGLRMGHTELWDHMFYDGLEDAYEKGTLMGVFAEKCASQFHFSRKEQDDFALHSLLKANTAIQNNWFSTEIAPVLVKTSKSEINIIIDELPLNAKPDKIPLLKPAFSPTGTVTAANSSGISDGAAAHMMMRLSEAEKRGLKPMAKIMGHATFSTLPSNFTIAPIKAISNLIQALNWNINTIDLFEINEAFAVVTMAAMKELDIPKEKINIHGGACALGHPIGASGARIVTTLLHALIKNNLRRGIASLCIGGGEAVAMAFEIL